MLIVVDLANYKNLFMGYGIQQQICLSSLIYSFSKNRSGPRSSITEGTETWPKMPFIIIWHTWYSFTQSLFQTVSRAIVNSYHALSKVKVILDRLYHQDQTCERGKPLYALQNTSLAIDNVMASLLYMHDELFHNATMRLGVQSHNVPAARCHNYVMNNIGGLLYSKHTVNGIRALFCEVVRLSQR